ncbi:MAG: hypothetical protein A2Y10_12380 [Planctomycetes bacterium GWF2_41_51]|nr:MAG: hypothetical protein A2Y10_12380 [Planctomycetes bacterium GWF2_41_51]HBG27219.1 hypothetical protein [Phycisphaerales bacterium]
MHSNNTELAIEHNGKVICRHSVPTAIPAIKDIITSIGGNIYLTFEEGPMAGWRFARPNKLWKYCGVGLVRSASGTDKNGKPKPVRLQLACAVNRLLKSVILAQSILSSIRIKISSRIIMKGCSMTG